MPSWSELVEEAMRNIGGKGELSKLYEEVKKVAQVKDPDKLKTNKNVEAKVRQVVQKSGLFCQEKKGSGIWALKKVVEVG